MTLTLSDRTSPAPPPAGGRRELLEYLALCIIAYVAGALALAAGSGLAP